MAKAKRTKDAAAIRTQLVPTPAPRMRLCFMNATPQNLAPGAVGVFRFNTSIPIKLEYLAIPFAQSSIVRAVRDDSATPAVSFISDGGFLSVQLTGGRPPSLIRVNLDHRIIRPGQLFEVEIENEAPAPRFTRVGLVYWPVFEEGRTI